MNPATPTDRSSVLTPPGRGAVAVVAAIGSAAHRAVAEHFQSARGKSFSELPVNRIHFGHWTGGGHREEVLLVRTSADALEVHCHGGVAPSQRIIDVMRAHGCHVQPWQDWIVETHGDEIVCEAEAALAKAATRRTAAILLDQRHGALRQAITSISAAIAASDLTPARQQLDDLLAVANFGLHLAQPWQVALAGRPNVGKSSLINALVGYQRAIVYDQPGTTRDVLTAETAVDGWPVRLIDAAGIRHTDDPLEAEGVARARQQLASADLVLWIDDATARHERPDPPIADARSRLPPERVVRVVNKIDLAPGSVASGDIAISALKRAGLDRLLEIISQRLVPKAPPPGAALPFTHRKIDLLQDLASRLPPRRPPHNDQPAP